MRARNWRVIGICFTIAASSAGTFAGSPTAPPLDGAGQRCSRGSSVIVGGTQVRVSCTSLVSNGDDSIHIEYCFDAGLSTETKHKQVSGTGGTGGKTSADTGNITPPTGAATFDWLIWYDHLQSNTPPATPTNPIPGKHEVNVFSKHGSEPL
jgi:hypothetical protein